MGRIGLAAMAALLAATPALAAAPKPAIGPKPAAPPVVRAPAPGAPTTTAPGPAVIYQVEQLICAALPAPLLEQLKPLNTLADVETFLKSKSVPFAWRRAEMDTTRLDPRLVTMVAQLPAGEVFVIPDGQQMFISVILGKRLAAAGAFTTETPR